MPRTEQRGVILQIRLNSRLSGQLYKDDFLLSLSTCGHSVSQAEEQSSSIPGLQAPATERRSPPAMEM